MIKLIITSISLLILTNCGINQQYPQVGLVEINGTILESEEIIKNLNYFYLREDIDGILVRVNSPGGGVAASQEIYEKIKNIRDRSEKPIIVSMSSMATSGGYYVSIGADSIVANPGSITGSIGVIMGYPTITKLMDLVGINYTTIKSGKFKDSGSPFRDTQNSDSQYLMHFSTWLNNEGWEEELTIEKKEEFKIDNRNPFKNLSLWKKGIKTLNDTDQDILQAFKDGLLEKNHIEKLNISLQ